MPDDASYVDNLRAIAPPARSKAYNEGDTVVAGCTLYVGSSGDITVDLARDANGTATIFQAVPVGPFPFRIKKIYDNTTTASGLVMVW